MCGTIVTLQFENATSGIKALETQDIVDVRSPEGVDTLGIVTYHTEVSLLATKLLHDLMLGKVGILILIHQNVAEEGTIASPHIGMVTKKQVGLQQQIVKVHRTRLPTTLLVTLVNLPNEWHPTLHIALYQLPVRVIPLSGYQSVLGIGNAALHHTDTVGLIVELHLFQDGFQQTFRVGRVINRKITGKADLLRLPAQDTGKDGMERTHPETLSC